MNTASTRNISIDTIRAAAEGIYDVVVRTPIVPLPSEPGQPQVYLKLETLQPIGSFKIRGAYNVIRHLGAEQLARRRLDGERRQRRAGGRARRPQAWRACSVMVMDTAPDTKLRAIERLGATIAKASYEECWRTVEEHRSDRMQGHFVHPFDDDLFISGNGTIGLEIVEDLPDVDAVIAPLGAGVSWPASPPRFATCAPTPSSTPPSRKPPRRLPHPSMPASPATSTAGRRRS